MNANRYSLLWAGAIFLAGASLVLLTGESKGQGPLDPAGAPAPSMKSLQEISDQIAELEEFRESSGQNVLVIRGNTAEVLTPISPDWINKIITGEPTHVAESNGSFLVVAGQWVYGFSAASGAWTEFNASAPIEKVASSKGSVLAFSTGTQAWGFRPSTGEYIDSGAGGPVKTLMGSD